MQRSQALAVGAVIVAAALTALFLQRFVPARVVLRETGGALLAAAAVVLACYAVGRSAIRDPRSGFLDRFLVGLPLFGTLIALVAWISVRPIVIVTHAAALAGIVLLIADNRSPVADPRRPPIADRPSWLLAPPILLALVAAIAPVNAPDELIYKLAVPHAYELYGRMVELPLNSNSYLAMAFQCTDLAALLLGGGIAAKLVHFALYLAALAAIHRLASRIAPRAGWWPVLVLAWTPALMLIAGWSFNEWGVLGLLALAVERYHRWLESRERSDFVVAFAAAGGAIAAKYTAVPFVAALALLMTWRHRREPRVLWKAALIVIAAGGFFYLRNAIWTGSPVAPLLLPDAPAVQSYRGESGWLDLVTGADVFDARVADESLGILLAASFLAGLLALRSRDATARDLALIGAIQMPILLTIGPGSRNIINGAAPLAIAGAALLGEAWHDVRPPLRAVFGAIVSVALAAQLVLVLFSFHDYDVLPYLAGSETAGQYVTRQRPFAKPYAWLARQTPRNARVLLLGENETYYLDRPFIAGGNLDGPRIAKWLARFPTPDALHAELRARGIAYVVLRKKWYRVGHQLLTPIESELVLEVPAETDRVVTAMLKTRAVLRYRDEEYLIFQLR
ncbi:MAG TPA: hypothetical protein VGR02_12715 [Thermoanaerobaculia bacterium]|nr:hypothetical protein [Thermoanaerobaculia bacterium]